MTLRQKFISQNLLLVALILLLVYLFLRWQNIEVSSKAFSLFSLSVLVFTWLLTLKITKALSEQLQLLDVALLNLQDNEFNSQIPTSEQSEFSRLATRINQVAEKLRRERQWLYQRELLLDKLLHNSPAAVVLYDQSDHIVFANQTAQQLFAQGKKLDGLTIAEVTTNLPLALQQALTQPKDGLFTLEPKNSNTEQQNWHLSRGKFELNGQQHQLILLKQLTRELNRQEVAVWKKVIRVISHEINNSLAPISSMSHSGKQLIKKAEPEKLELVFNTITERIQHLNQFIQGYAKFAKLPLPQLAEVELQPFFQKLAEQYQVNLQIELNTATASFDAGQIEQVLINLLKNAQESGSEQSDIYLSVQQTHHTLTVSVTDRGQGMSSEVLENALIPFYSTKQSGTGLGLALCREIIDAHDGQLHFTNRENGGLKVSFSLALN